nr:FXYD domain-containing ion transport regulator 7 isoform X4 [Camelus dromedarius]
MCFPLLTALCRSVSPSARKAWGPPWPQQGAPPPLGKGRGRRQWAGAGAGVTGTGAGSLGLHWLRPPPHQGSHHLPPTSVCPASSCCSRAFTASASNCPLLQPGMATPTEVPTKDYDTVQTVGMTLATILFLLGILIIVSKKVKCRKADSRSESPTCKSCWNRCTSPGLGNDPHKEPVCIPDPGTQASSRGPGVQPPRIPVYCSRPPPCLLSEDPFSCTLGVSVLSLINVHLIFPPVLSVCSHLWGQNGGGAKLHLVELSPPSLSFPSPSAPWPPPPSEPPPPPPLPLPFSSP